MRRKISANQGRARDCGLFCTTEEKQALLLRTCMHFIYYHCLVIFQAPLMTISRGKTRAVDFDSNEEQL